MNDAQKSERAWRIGVLSDTHGDKKAIALAMAELQREGPLDALCFLGDCVDDLRQIEKRILLQEEATTRICIVRGNNDFLSDFPDAYMLHMGGLRLLCVHGHLQRVKSQRLALVLCAQEAEADIVLFGHTHRPECGYEQGILLLNPGAASGSAPTCALLTLREGGVEPRMISLIGEW